MNDKERSEKLLEMLKRHNAEVNEVVEDWREEQPVLCKDQEVRIDAFSGGDVIIKFKKDSCMGSNHTHVEIWTKGTYRGYFHVTEKRFDFHVKSDNFEGGSQ